MSIGPSGVLKAGTFVKAIVSNPKEGGAMLDTISLPDYPPQGYYRVKMIRSQICNADRRALGGTKKNELRTQKIVLGHEGLGVIVESSIKTSTRYNIGDLVVLCPHLLSPDDQMHTYNLPNLSPHMKHMGIHTDGVFADVLDYPEYNVYKIPKAQDIIQRVGKEAYYNQMVLVEPLACVQRGIKLVVQRELIRDQDEFKILILGGGPMGILHAMHLQNTFPHTDVSLYDPDPLRQDLATHIPGLHTNILSYLEPSLGLYDLVIVATSNFRANVQDCFQMCKHDGTVLLFSGIDLLATQHYPVINGIDIEVLHRYEGFAQILDRRNESHIVRINIVGTSGYVKEDFATAIEELHTDLMRNPQPLFKGVATAYVNHLDGKILRDLSGRAKDAIFLTPALLPMLALYNERMEDQFNVRRYLKIYVKH